MITDQQPTGVYVCVATIIEVLKPDSSHKKMFYC